MLTYQYLDLDEVLDTIASRPENQHVIVTGRACHRLLMEMADTVSEVQNTKHAFDNGIKAQKVSTGNFAYALYSNSCCLFVSEPVNEP